MKRNSWRGHRSGTLAQHVSRDAPSREFEPVLFTHGTICWPIVRRDTAAFLAFTACEFLTALVTRGRSLLWAVPDTELAAYRSAQYRLKRSGWLACRRADGGPPTLESANSPLPPGARMRLHPMRRWNRAWDGTWWVLCYDVPESQRAYRVQLRRFVEELGMGSLQKSVFIIPDDIRAKYQDLDRAAAVTEYSVLFASRSVLGRSNGEVARIAWDMDPLRARQSDFATVARARARSVKEGAYSLRDLRRLREHAFHVYWDVMRSDPLLPRAAWPTGYAGERAHEAHADLQRAIRGQMLSMWAPPFRRRGRPAARL